MVVASQRPPRIPPGRGRICLYSSIWGSPGTDNCFPCSVRSTSSSHRGKQKPFHRRGGGKNTNMCFLPSMGSTFERQKCFPCSVRSTSFFQLPFFYNNSQAKTLLWILLTRVFQKLASGVERCCKNVEANKNLSLIHI